MTHLSRRNRILSCLVTVFISLPGFSQDRTNPLSNFISPFQSKVSSQATEVVYPKQESDKAILIKPGNQGEFFLSLEKENLELDEVVAMLPQWFNLDESLSFRESGVFEDDLSMTHFNYQLYCEGYPVEGCLVFIHTSNGVVISLNGQVITRVEAKPHFSISEDQALEIAQRHLRVNGLIQEYGVETVVGRSGAGADLVTRWARKVRIDSTDPFTMAHVYVDAVTGEVFNVVNLIADADVPGTAQTLYSGSQSIICDSNNGSFRLRESGRKIETYNATNSSGLTGSGYAGSSDFTSTTSNWGGVLRISSFTVSAIAQGWWYAPFSDESPDIYFRVKDGSNQIVYSSMAYGNTQPPVSFNNLSILLTNPPYTIELWDDDTQNADDLGGSYSVNITPGTHAWSGDGNNGTYTVTNSGHPALDVHWGMEKTYDYYLSTFNRNSYNGSGGVIRQYLNAPDLQSQYGNSPNNAFASGPPYNIMVYGLGDNQFMRPVVGLDVEGHEFTHLVVNYSNGGGLAYQGESGALNESFADIFGTCIEFYALGSSGDWTIGEDVTITQSFLRSMSNPNAAGDPDTYQGQYWINPSNLQNDNGGVHVNSGVQNFWFYLLCQGGSGTNDIGNAYSVTGIGISDAQRIAYRNLMNYLGSHATYMDAYYGSLQAAQDLFGNPSAQYDAVRAAWYAVGIGNDANEYCSGTTTLTAPSGTVTDGSGNANYSNYANCKWVIAPPGANQILLTFTAFDTEANYDTVFVYNGPSENSPLLAAWWGNTIPPVLSTTAGVGALCIRFRSDPAVTGAGWSADYTIVGNEPACSGGTVLANASGVFSDGSANNNYGNNQTCYWYIAPPCASSVTLNFSQFSTEANYDGVVIRDDWSGGNQLAAFSGTGSPPSVTSATGKMMVVFVSDYATVLPGFTASYTSTGSAHCSGTTTLDQTDYGTLSDGSGSGNYCNNLDCKWLIQPPQATSVTLEFTEFDVEPSSSDGLTFYDALEVYDGTDATAPLLGRFAGNALPPSVTSSGGSLFVHFHSDLAENKQGWEAFYTSTQEPYCTGTTTLTGPSGTFEDGSAEEAYANNSSCYWLIKPDNGQEITLSFSEFDTEADFDGVVVYDGEEVNAEVLGAFTGSDLPETMQSSGSALLVEFLSDPALRKNGWLAHYTTEASAGLEKLDSFAAIRVYPNPTDGKVTVLSSLNSDAEMRLYDVTGREMHAPAKLNKGENALDVSTLSAGVYWIAVISSDTEWRERLIVK